MVDLAPREKIAIKFGHSRRCGRFLKYYFISVIAILLGISVYLEYVAPSFSLIPKTWLAVSLILLGIILWLVAEIKKIAGGRYYITNERIIAEKGILRTKMDSVTYNMIVNIKMTRGFVDKLLGIGNIEISTARGHQELDIKGIKNSGKVENLIYEYIESPEEKEMPQRQFPVSDQGQIQRQQSPVYGRRIYSPYAQRRRRR